MPKRIPRRRSRSTAPPPLEQIGLRWFDLGTELNQLQKDEISDRFPALAQQYLVKPTNYVRYKSQQLARLFEGQRGRLVGICQLDAEGVQITQSHLVELLQVKSIDEIESLARQVIENRIGSKVLRRMIRERQGGRGSRRPGSGRKRQAPRNRAEALRQAQSHLESLKFYVAAAVKRSRGKKKSRLQEVQDRLNRIGALESSRETPAMEDA